MMKMKKIPKRLIAASKSPAQRKRELKNLLRLMRLLGGM